MPFLRIEEASAVTIARNSGADWMRIFPFGIVVAAAMFASPVNAQGIEIGPGGVRIGRRECEQLRRACEQDESNCRRYRLSCRGMDDDEDQDEDED